MKMKCVGSISRLLAVALLSALFMGCTGDDYPSKPVTLLVGFGAGTSADTAGRILAQLVEKHLGQPVNVVNKPGTSGAMSYQDLYDAKNDGYTIAMGTMTLIAHNLMGTIKFSYADLTPIVTFQTDPNLLYFSAQAPFKTWDEMIAYSKANPGEVTCATSSVGGITNIVANLLLDKLGLDWKLVVGTSGGADGVTQAAGGHVMMAVASPLEALSFVESGDVIPVGVTTTDRLVNTYPDVPTFRELGCDLVIGNIRSFFGPPKMDEKKAAILQTAFDKAIRDEKFVDNVNKTGAAMLHLNAADTRKAYAAMTEDLTPILKK